MSRNLLFGVMLTVPILSLTGCPPSNTIQTETIMLPGNVPLEMVWIAPGSFLMGEIGSTPNEPQHQVTLFGGFWMGKFELTQAQWVALMGTNPSTFPGDSRPVEEVTWDDAQAFITALNQYTGLAFGLPSEAQWEFACRASTPTTRFYWGDDPGNTQIDNYAWYNGNSGAMTQDVGGKQPNVWGLYDMSGNVWEWCEDDLHADYTGAPTNGAAWVDSPRATKRIIRGGTWFGDPVYCESAFRGSYEPNGKLNRIGFRLVR